MTEEDAHEAVDFMLQDNKLGDAAPVSSLKITSTAKKPASSLW